ncbi:MAG: hypothetical protein AAFQ84_09165, partial [Pseudomonadota bacterium]
MANIRSYLRQYPARSALMTVALLMALLLLAVRLFAMSGMAHRLVEQQLAGLGVSGQTINLEGLSGDLLGRMTADGLSVADMDGVWLTVDEIEVAWSPLALTGRHLKLRSVSIDQISVLRDPILPPSTEEGESQGGSSPLKRYSLRELDIRAVQLDPSVVPDGEALAVSASVDTTISAGIFEAQLGPVIGEGDQLDANIQWGGEVPLDGALEARGPVDGLLARALQIDATAPLRFALAGRGEIEDWVFSLNGVVGDDTFLEFASQGGRTALSANGEVDLTVSGWSRDLASQVGERLLIEASPDDEAMTSLSVETSNVRIETALGFDLQARRLDVDRIPLRVWMASLADLTDDAVTGSASIDGEILSRQDTWVFDG